MLETRRGTEDGVSIREYFSAEYYEVSDRLARAFIAAGFAIEIKPPALCAQNRPRKSRRKRRNTTLQLIKE